MTESPPAGPAVVWFRRDLRLEDNPAWAAASAHHDVVALFVVQQTLMTSGSAHRRRLLSGHLRALDDSLRAMGGRLVVRTGRPAEVVAALVVEVGATAVYWNDDTTPWSVRRDAAVRESLAVPVGSWYGGLVHRPGSVLTNAGALSRVFTPFWKQWDRTTPEPWPEPGEVSVLSAPSEAIPEPDGDPWQPPGEDHALARLAAWANDGVDRYHELRDRPDVDATSHLSADLRFGTLSPRRVLAEVGTHTEGRAAFVRQLAWRDWYAHLLADLPDLPRAAVRPEFDRVRWAEDPDGLLAWQQGRTGYPLVDAAMRELAATGWMHNRLRMVAASFLVKDLLIDWRHGERWFRRLLVDGDVAQNSGNWQWVAGTGPDAAPYFRVFNPVTQSRRFDPQGTYLRRWLPELAGLGPEAIHAPWEAAPLDLAAAGVVLGDTYPAPLVDHAAARDRTIAAYSEARDTR